MIRSACVLVDSVFSAFAEAHLSTSYSSSWVEGMTAGRGWITITLTIFALWNPGRAIFASFIFGGIFVLQYLLQLRDFSQFSSDSALPVYDRNPSDHLL